MNSGKDAINDNNRVLNSRKIINLNATATEKSVETTVNVVETYWFIHSNIFSEILIWQYSPEY